jgi:DNA-binding beta-propeller fold protein YncE
MRWQLRLFLATALAACLPVLLVRGGEESKYPHVNVATVWEVDAKWPQKPRDYVWGHVSGMAVDDRDQVYVFTRSTPPVQVYDKNGKFLRAWGDKTIDTAHHIKIGPDGHVWVADIGYHQIQKYTPEGKLLLAIGTKGEAGRDKTHLNMPTDMAITPDGDIYVADGYGNARVVHFDKDGKYVNEWGELGHGPGQFSIPHAIAYSKGQIYVADRNNVRVQVFDPRGKYLTEWKNLIVPWGFCVDGEDNIWVCGSSPMQWRKTDGALGCPPKDQLVMKFTPDGRVTHVFGIPKGLDGLERPGEVNWVHAIALDSQGNIYLGDIIGRRAQKFSLRRP